MDKKRVLMDGLGRLIGADCWLWGRVPEVAVDCPPAYTSLSHGGLDEEALDRVLAASEHPAVGRLSSGFAMELRDRGAHLTRSRRQLDPEGAIESGPARELWQRAGIGDGMLSYRPLEGGGLSAVSIYRRCGRRTFSARETRMAHIVLTEVPWLHEAAWPEVAGGVEVPKLSPRRLTVLNLMLEGHARKEMATRLGISTHTLDGYVKDIFRHFRVHSQVELIARFRSGDGYDTPGSGD